MSIEQTTIAGHTSYYGETFRGSTYGLNVEHKEQVELANHLKSGFVDEYMPIPGISDADQQVRIGACECESDVNTDLTYWENENGSHGWCCKHCGKVHQWG